MRYIRYSLPTFNVEHLMSTKYHVFGQRNMRCICLILQHLHTIQIKPDIYLLTVDYDLILWHVRKLPYSIHMGLS